MLAKLSQALFTMYLINSRDTNYKTGIKYEKKTKKLVDKTRKRTQVRFNDLQ